MADPRVDVNLHCGMNFGSDAVVTPNPNFVNFGLVSVNITEKLGSVSVTTTRHERAMNSSDWIWRGNDIEEATADRVSEKKKTIFILKNIF